MGSVLAHWPKFKEGVPVVSDDGHRGVVVGEDKIVKAVKFVRFEHIKYAGDSLGSPIHETRLKLAPTPSTPIVPVVEAKGKVIQLSSLSRITSADKKIEDGVLDVRTAQEPSEAPLIDETWKGEGAVEFGEEAQGQPAQQPVVPEQPQPGFPADITVSRPKSKHEIQKLVLEKVDADLKQLFGSTIIPETEVKEIEPLAEEDAWVISLVFKDTLGERKATGMAVVAKGTFIPPGKLYMDGKEAGSFNDLPSLFQEVPGTEAGMIEELQGIPSPARASLLLNTIRSNGGDKRYRRAFDIYSHHLQDKEIDELHELAEVGLPMVLKAFLMKRGCEACNFYHQASAHCIEATCGKVNRPIYEVTEAQCRESVE